MLLVFLKSCGLTQSFRIFVKNSPSIPFKKGKEPCASQPGGVRKYTKHFHVRLCENKIEPQNIEQACLTAVKADREPQNVEVEYASIHVY